MKLNYLLVEFPQTANPGSSTDTESFIDKNKIKDNFGGEVNGDSHLQVDYSLVFSKTPNYDIQIVS